MIGTRLRFETARGCMKLLAGQTFLEMFEIFGVNVEELEEVTGSTPWTAHSRQRVRRVLDAIAQGVMDVVGAPRFEVSAEYIAGVIVAFVHPVNVMVACRWMEQRRPATGLLSGEADAEFVSPTQIFALCNALYDDEASYAIKHQFEKRVQKAIGKATDEGGETRGKSK